MDVKEEFTEAQRRFGLLSFYDKFEHIVILILTALIAIFIVFAVWNLALKIFQSIAASTFDPTDYTVFQAVFGMIFTLIIALELKRSLLVVAERQHSVVQVRTVVLIALLAIVRKLLILEVGHATEELFALAAAITRSGPCIGLSEIRTEAFPRKDLRGIVTARAAWGEKRKLRQWRDSQCKSAR